MITIKNTQRKIKINTAQLCKNIQKILDKLDYSDYDIGLWITTNSTIRKFNKQYRNKDKATSILSFSFHPDLKPNQRIKTRTECDKNLGDMIISAEFIKKDAPNWNQSFNKRLNATIIHGICHLLGYTHNTEKDFQQMLSKETQFMDLISSQNT